MTENERSINMEEEEKIPNTTAVFITDREGKTYEINAKAGALEWPAGEKDDEQVEPKTYTATLTVRMGKRTRTRLVWALNGCKSRKEYRKLKKTNKMMRKHVRVIFATANPHNPRKKRSLAWIEKLRKNRRLLIVKEDTESKVEKPKKKRT